MTIVDEIRHQIEIEGFALKDFFLTQPPPPYWAFREDKAIYFRWLKRERRRRAIAQVMAHNNISVHDLMRGLTVTATRRALPPPPTAEQIAPTFIARFANGHETCTNVFCPPDKLDVAKGVMLARQAFARLMGAASEHEIVSARFKYRGVVLAHYNVEELQAGMAQPVRWMQTRRKQR